MVKFLLQRPIAVLMAFTACFIIGLITYFTLPVSLLPNIAIPEITVQVTGENTSARELENTVVSPVRRQLLQVSGLRDIESETRDGAGVIRLKFEFGTNTDLAFIEVNEKIDAAMNSLPKETVRPKAIKASATDIPVFYLNLTLKGDEPYKETDSQKFLQLCEFAENVIKRRIEQLPQVAMADITGAPGRELQIIPDFDLMQTAGLTSDDIENALSTNNVEPGSMIVRDGYYEYNIRIASLLRSAEDVENIYIRKNGRMMQLKDFCKVNVVPQKELGRSLANGKRAVTLAVIKQAEENMDDLKKELKRTTDYFSTLYPDIDFEICRNQTELLDYTISNLQQNLSLGFLFIFLIAILFMGDIKSPLVIGISMIVSVIMTFLLFYLCHISFNIISLSGLILAVGMMIDSAIIVTENISQWREKGYSLKRACAVGTSEMITPMLSSSLTTVAVFVPLIFMSGMAGAIFFDQAFAVTAGLAVSYITGIMLLPVLYLLFTKFNIRKRGLLARKFSSPAKDQVIIRFYDRGIEWVFAHKKSCLLFTIGTLPLCVFLFFFIRKERMPAIDQNELIARIEWNENIHIDENNRRVDQIQRITDSLVTGHTAYIGMQDYLLNSETELSSSEAELYFKTESPKEIQTLQEKIYEAIKGSYPQAIVTFSPPETVFEKLFDTGEADVNIEIQPKNKERAPEAESLRKLERELSGKVGKMPSGMAFQQQLNLEIDREKLLLYNVSFNELSRTIRTAFKENKVSILRSYQHYLPINIAGEEHTVNRVLQETSIPTQRNEDGSVNYIPLYELVKVYPGEDLKNITAGKNGEYIPLRFYEVENVPELVESASQYMHASDQWEADFSGSFFSNKQMIGELTVILFISILLMYFILSAQFESFVQPLIVLIEIPIDVSFALLLLWVCGHTLNLMSAIGIIVTCGIIINDSILKLDTINELRKGGMPLIEAIHEAGRRRLRAIIMTSLTTIFAMVPLLFSFDMGSELQKPLSIAMIGAMVIGTLVSLFIVPLFYWFIYRKREL